MAPRVAISTGNGLVMAGYATVGEKTAAAKLVNTRAASGGSFSDGQQYATSVEDTDAQLGG
jgi:hypothetical protein